MTGILFLVPIAVAMGLLALMAFLWTLHSGQYEDLEGASQRMLDDETPPP
jgi:cbb3-type cytochrome oxidase maturation protein